MPSAESHAQRRGQNQRQRPDLNINTAAAASNSPRRPPVPSKGRPPVSNHNSSKLRYSPASTRESGGSFLDNPTPIDMHMVASNKENERPNPGHPRDSHDLSLPSRQFTRDSLVTNMLSSLDQFSLSQINTPTAAMYDDPDPYPDYPRNFTMMTSRSHIASHAGPGHNYQYSSDFEMTDDAASRLSSQFSRGRRSNSSSGPQSSIGRMNSAREQRSHPGTPGVRPAHSRGGKTSKSSSTNSIDGAYSQALATQRWAQSVGGARASSFDYGQQRPSFTPPSDSFLVDDYEAAPTPTIPGGPRRPVMPSPPPAPPATAPHPAPMSAPPAPEPKTPDRKRNVRSRSGTGSKSVHGKSTHTSEVPPVPTTTLNDSAPAPHVGYNKSAETSKGGIPSSNSNTKEKPGFFRRVFGSRNPTSNVADAPTQSATPSQPAPPTRQQSDRSQPAESSPKMKAQSAPPSRDSQPPMPHVIQKKSSFFRRRKKSVTEPPLPVPPVPAPINLALTRDADVALPEPSPVSSLRQVMNPYLKGSTPSTPGGMVANQLGGPPHTSYDTETRNDESGRRARGFSPDYEPSPGATIRTVKSQSALKTQPSTASLSRPRTHVDSPSREPPAIPTQNRPPPPGRDATFFNDSSDEGDGTEESVQLRPQQPPPAAPSRKSSFAASAKEKPDSPRMPEKQLNKKQSFARAEPSPNLLLQTNASNEAMSRSAGSLPSLRIDTAEPSPSLLGPKGPLDEPVVSVGEPTDYDRQKAQQIYDGNEDFISKEKAASWMGEEGLVRQRVLRAYMELYDFANTSVLNGLRQICGRLVFRAETQQVDRILVAFSKRWCECNPSHGFKATDVIHTMCYSIMLLNTDLHLADIEQKMTRSQFVKNTMTTVKQALADFAPDTLSARPSILPEKNSLLNPGESEDHVSPEQERASWRSSFKPLPRSESALGNYMDSPADDGCGPLVKTPFEGPMRAWEAQMEIVLKDVYGSIRDTRLPLFGAEPNQPQSVSTPNSLSVMSKLKRTPSVLSKAPSESQISMRGRMNDPNRSAAARWASKSRSRPRLGGGFSSSRTSFEDANSLWSPATSSATWSKYSLGRTQTSGSVDTFNSAYPGGDYQQSIGFANALSQAIIREDYDVGPSSQSIMSDDTPAVQLLEDESLELAGPPWVKEGMVTHKHHLDGIDKKAKDRNWSEVFAVIQKGTLSLFSFSSKSMRQKSRAGRKPAAGAVVGGGNWQDNAVSVGTFSLRQTLASALPPPGYSRIRPHVWALSLPTGAVHLFQVGTPEISKEFVLTVNYWSARLSTHPLVGGISNIEYGWSDAVINTALVGDVNETPLPPRPGSAAAGRTHSRQGSRQSSLRSSFDIGSGTARAKLPGDKVHIAEWAPPAQSMRPSNCSESEQLKTLVNYVDSIEEDLQQHNQLRSPMLLAFTTRGHNATKAMANWERKSSYLLREIVKFRTYVDSLQTADTRRTEIYTERDNARRAAVGEDVLDTSDDDEDEADITLRPE